MSVDINARCDACRSDVMGDRIVCWACYESEYDENDRLRSEIKKLNERIEELERGRR